MPHCSLVFSRILSARLELDTEEPFQFCREDECTEIRKKRNLRTSFMYRKLQCYLVPTAWIGEVFDLSVLYVQFVSHPTQQMRVLWQRYSQCSYVPPGQDREGSPASKRPRLLTSTTFQLYYSIVILLFVQYKLEFLNVKQMNIILAFVVYYSAKNSMCDFCQFLVTS